MPDTPSTFTPAPASTNTYDDVPYESHPFAQTHPSRLYTIGTLFGLRPTPVGRCRVLELGSASGGNILPMAEAFPDSEFVGVDYSERQIKDGLATVEKLGLSNVTLKHASILDVDESYGKFDYVICHGVFSWVPPNVQDKILQICAEQTTPQAISYISYNTFPGWHMRGMIRDMMRYHAARFTTAQHKTQQARALLDFLAKSVKQDASAYSTLLKTELETLRTQADHYLYHEHLEEHNEPLYFHSFAERAQKAGLKYLGEARVGTMVTGNFGPEIEQTLKMVATDQIMAEQYMDFLRNRMFRETLLCSASLQPNWAVNPEVVRGLHAASNAAPVAEISMVASDENVSFKGPSGMTMATNRPLLKAAMVVLKKAFPATVPFEELRREARELVGGATGDARQTAEDAHTLAIGLLNCYMQSDLVELHGAPVQFGRQAGEKPVALPLARLQASRGATAANRRHEVVRLNELDRHLVPLLDGGHDRPALVAKLTEVAKSGKMNVQRDNVPLRDEAEIRTALTQVIEQALANVARLGILQA